MPSSPTAAKPPSLARLLFWLMLGAFAVGTEGFVIAGILPALAAGLEVPLGQAGQLVTVFALVYAAAAPVTAVLTAGWPRERVLRLAMAGFALANLAAAFAPGFGGLMAARAALAVFAGLYMATAGAYAALAVPAEQRGRAMAFVYTGMSVATVIGVPAGTWIGDAFGWRSTFVAVAALSALALAGLCLPRTPQPRLPAPTLAQRLAIARQPAVLRALLLTTCAFGGAFAVHTFVSPLLQQGAALSPAAVAWVLMLFGLAGVFGNWAGGLLSDRRGPQWVVRRSPAILAVLFCAIGVIANTLPPAAAAWPLLLAIAAWGVAGWAFAPAQQTALVQLAPHAPPIVLSLNSSALYLGISLGAFAGSAAVSLASVRAVPWVGFAFELAALAIALGARGTANAPGMPHAVPQPERR